MGVARGAQREHAHRRVRPRGAARRRGDDDPRDLPVTSGDRVVLFHSPGCHLCEKARDVLVAELGDGGFDEVDITGDDELEPRYREWLPVVEIGGERAFVYFVDPAALRRKVAQTRP